MGTLTFIKNKFGEYYEGNLSSLKCPSSMEKREFGFLLFEKRIMLRHKRFLEFNELVSTLRSLIPSDAYYSCAYYENPEAEMDVKGWLGSDLVFDIDADHIPTPCAKIHDRWTCSNCGMTGRGATPNRCPACGKEKFEEKKWPCEVCLESAKVETIKLLEFLTDDFGFSPSEIIVAFSGHRGYHVHVESEVVHELDAMARKEIVDYVTGIGLETSLQGLEESGKKRRRILGGPDLSDKGWRGRIARGTYTFLSTATAEDLEEIGLRKKEINTILSKRELFLKCWEKTGPWGTIKGLGVESWKKIARRGAELQSAKIDTVVTTDIHRLIRMTGTLHGKTGLRKTEVSTSQIESFDPLKEAAVFKKGTETIFISEAPEFRIGDQTFGPYRNEKIELPTAAAMFLLCKGAATVIA